METVKVLLIEDDQTTREKLSKIITKQGFEVLTEEDGIKGIEVFKKQIPDIVVTDYKLAGADGLKVLKTVKEINPEACVILITAFGETDVAIAALQQGALDYIKKPIDIDLLTLALGRAYEKVAEYKKIQNYPNILLVEDEETTRKRLADILEKEGWQVSQAGDGQQALKIFDRKKIDLVLLDIKMPKKDGLATLHEMREITDDFEAVILTGYGDETSAIQAMRDGAINFLKKPIDLEQMLVTIEKAIEKLNTRKALKYRKRELELSKEVIARITEDNEIIIDFNKNLKKPAMDFAQELLNSMPMALVVLDSNLKIVYINRYLSRVVNYKPQKIESKFLASLTKIGIKTLSLSLLKSTVEKLFNSPVGKIKRLEISRYAYIVLTILTILMGKKKNKYVFMVIRGERK